MAADKNLEIDQNIVQQVTEAITGYLKWHNNTVGIIFDHNYVGFINPDLNPAVKKLNQGRKSWSKEEFVNFLSGRIVSQNRNDIKHILSRLKVSDYDITEISEKSYAFNPNDSFWIAASEADRFENKISEFLSNILGISLNEGSKKSFGLNNGKYGIFKNRLDKTTDLESELACYRLSCLFGVKICPVMRVSKDVIFSEFMYDFSKESLIFAGDLLKREGISGDLHTGLCLKYPDLTDDIDRIFIFDFITRQIDRHVNLDIKIDDKGVSSLYPLYDNGRSLFWNEDEIRIERAVKNIKISGVVEKIATCKKISILINLDINPREIGNILSKSGFSGYKLDGCLKWITGAIELMKNMV